MNYYLNKLMIYHEVHQMKRAGFSIQKTAGHLVIDWRTAKRILLLSEENYLQKLEAPLGKKCSLDAYEEFVREKLILYPSSSAVQMHDWLKEHDVNSHLLVQSIRSTKYMFYKVHLVSIFVA